MNYTQNRKIMQVTETTLVVGVDIGSQWHYARAFDWRGIELTRKVFRFSNDLDGYVAFEEWVQNVSEKSAKMDILIAKDAGAIEKLKAADPLTWVGLMNACKAQAEEIILVELIYC